MLRLLEIRSFESMGKGAPAHRRASVGKLRGECPVFPNLELRINRALGTRVQGAMEALKGGLIPMTGPSALSGDVLSIHPEDLPNFIEALAREQVPELALRSIRREALLLLRARLDRARDELALGGYLQMIRDLKR